jgi:hypothetical protein
MEDPMSNQDFRSDLSKPTRLDRGAENVGTAAGDALSKASEMVQDAAAKAKQAASDTAATVTSQIKELLDHQVGSGAEVMGQFASSARRAAEDLDQGAPQIAGLVRALAERTEGYANDLRNQSVDQLVRAASDFTRRQPALVFGLAALAGFFACRAFKAAPSSVASPSIQPSYDPHRPGASEFHGV